MKNLKNLIALFLSTFLFSGVYAAQFPVTTTFDAPVPPPGSFRAAILAANATPGLDTILFVIPAPPGIVQTIFPIGQLPALTDQAGVVINGLTQANATCGPNPPQTLFLLVELDGANTGPAHGLVIQSSNNIIQGLVIQNFEQDGIRIEATNIGTNNNYIHCNIVGLNPAGTTRLQGNGWNLGSLWGGIHIVPTNCTGIAHQNIIERNLVSGNYADGISIENCPPLADVAFTLVIANYIGTDITGLLDRGNIYNGVLMAEGTHDNDVVDNVISGNDWSGVCIVGYPNPPFHLTFQNHIFLNQIGVASDFLSPLPNSLHGVNIGKYGTQLLGYGQDNDVVDNHIAFNGGHGIMIYEHFSNPSNSDGNLLGANSIHNNVQLGIDLDDDLVTLNDPGDLDNAANQDVNYPIIDSAMLNPVTGITTVYGTLNLFGGYSSAFVEIFRAQLDPSGYGEGMFFAGGGSPDALGNFMIQGFGLAAGDSVTATTIDSARNTSEFCLVVPVMVQCVPPSNLRTSKLQPKKARLEWDTVPGVNGYVVRGRNINNPSWILINIPSGSNSFLDASGLAYGGSYIWQIKSACGSQFSAWSATDTFTTLCQAPDSNWASSIGRFSAILNWNKAFASVGYEIKGGIVGGGSKFVQVGGGNTLSKAVAGLSNASSYHWKVRSWCDINGLAKSAYTPYDTFTTQLSGSARLYGEKDLFDEKAEIGNVSLFPNPVDDFAMLLFDNPDNTPFTLQITDLAGKEIRKLENIKGNSIVISKSDLNSGVYLYKLLGDYIAKGKFVIR